MVRRVEWEGRQRVKDSESGERVFAKRQGGTAEGKNGMEG